MPGGKKPAAKREQAIAALISAGTVEKAAAQCGIAERTLRNWLHEREFRTAYRTARRRLLDDAVLVLQTAAVTAVATLVKHMQGPKPEAAVRAAQIVLDQCFRGTEVLDLFEELEQLREEVNRVHNDAQARGAETPSTDSSANGEARADSGATSQESGSPDGTGGNEARQLAAGVADDDVLADIPTMFG